MRFAFHWLSAVLNAIGGWASELRSASLTSLRPTGPRQNLWVLTRAEAAVLIIVAAKVEISQLRHFYSEKPCSIAAGRQLNLPSARY
jgi:hypothetical protein